MGAQIETLESASEQAKKQAQTAKDHIDTAKEQRTKIKNLVENLSGRKLGDLVDQLNNDRRTDEISQDLSDAEQQYEDLLAAFEKFKQNQQDQQNDIESKLRQDESNMDKLKETR